MKSRMFPPQFQHLQKRPISAVKKADIIAEIERSGCDMLKGKMDGTESKETIVKYLKKCDCPVLKSKFSGIEKK